MVEKYCYDLKTLKNKKKDLLIKMLKEEEAKEDEEEQERTEDYIWIDESD